MNYNNKAIEALFESKKNYKAVMSDAYDKMQDSIEEDMTLQEAMQQFLYEFEIIASEFLAEKLFKTDLEEGGDASNHQLDIAVLQSMIDEESEYE